MNVTVETRAIRCAGVGKFYSTRAHWALRDASFEVTGGEVLGLVGHNGAGKSTLLRILASVIKPTTGSASLNGKVVALLDSSCGFHRELTGRENIHFAAGLLGMGCRQTAAELESILDLADAYDWLDWKVRELSAGMWMRLALSVGLHLNGDILLVDEVLGVGDERFRGRCQAKIRARAQAGKTVLMVSHDLNLVEKLCSRVLWMEKGRILETGPPTQILSKYRNKVGAPGFEPGNAGIKIQ